VFAAILLSILSRVSAALQKGGSTDPFRPLDLDGAVRSAQIEKKCVLVVVARAGAPETKKLDGTFGEAKVREWMAAKAIAIRVDFDRQPDLAARFRVHILPTMVFLNDKGLELDRLTGHVDGRTFRAEAESILAGGDPVARVRKRLVGHENEPHLRIDLAGALYDRGLLEEAMREYLWCWDHGVEFDPGFAEARRDFLLREIVRLGRVYTPASDELATRAATLFERVVDCSATLVQVRDFLTINQTLQQDDRTLAAWDAITKDPTGCEEMQKMLAPNVLDALIDARRYKEAAERLGDAVARFDAAATAFEADAKRWRKERPEDAEAKIEVERRALRVDACRWFETLLGAGRYDDADKLSARVLAHDGKGATYTALLRAALRAESHGAAKSIARRAEADKKLSEAEKAEVRTAAKQILQPK